MPSFSEVAGFKNQLIRKALGGALLVADYAAGALTDICESGGDLTLDAEYISLGKLSTDGISSESELEKSEIRGWGDSFPSRVDVTTETSTLTCTAMETKGAVLDAFYGVDQSAVTANANGTITFDKPPVPVLRDKRVLALGRDVNKRNGLDVYFGIHYPKANLSQSDAQALANGDDALQYPLTISALLDDDEGTAVRLFWGGPGLADLIEDMGYTSVGA